MTEARARPDVDAVVVGAGPAGSLVARELALGGLDVLLVEKRAWPRRKVCGACLGPGALRVLDATGLGSLPAGLGAIPLERLLLAGWGRQANVVLRGSRALSRSAFDAALAESAQGAGATFRPSTRARLGPVERGAHVVELDGADGTHSVTTAVVVAADGLGGGLLAASLGSRPALATMTDSRVGVGAALPDAPPEYRPGTIYMAVGPRGYVGLVRQEDGHLNAAAALDPAALRRRGGVEGTVARIVREAGFPELGAQESGSWRGTPALTRRPDRPGGECLFALGDAAGYVEPFTGEGIGWALADAVALAPLVVEAVAGWHPALLERWCAHHARRAARAQRLCRAAAWTLRRPRLSRATLTVLSVLPQLASPFVARAGRTPMVAGEVHP